MIRVTIWNEFRHEKKRADVKAVYPDGIHMALAKGLAADDLQIRTATLDDPEQGLADEVLDSTDVLMWWGHAAHNEVTDENVKRIVARVQSGMGLVVLHSGHSSKLFKAICGTSCSLKWREAGERERLWCIEPFHPIAQGVPAKLTVNELMVHLANNVVFAVTLLSVKFHAFSHVFSLNHPPKV